MKLKDKLQEQLKTKSVLPKYSFPMDKIITPIIDIMNSKVQSWIDCLYNNGVEIEDISKDLMNYEFWLSFDDIVCNINELKMLGLDNLKGLHQRSIMEQLKVHPLLVNDYNINMHESLSNFTFTLK